jgi:hypothetical protein
MQLDEITVEVRNASLQKVGQLTALDLVGSTFIMRFNNTGSWSVRLSPIQPLADVLRSPGSGLVLTGPNGVIISGPTRTAKLEQTTANNLGVWVIEGTDDSVVLSERLAYPDPSQEDVTLQAQANDTRTGAAETVIKGYIEDNISFSAGTSRAISNLRVEADQGRGLPVTGRARFISLQELVYPLSQTGSVGYQVVQDGSDIEFQVYEPRDLTASIRMDLDNGKLTRTEYSYISPQATRAIVGGSGEAVDRLFYEGTSSESISAEAVWGRRIEIFLDDRGTDSIGDLDQKAQELLVETGKTIVNLAVTPSDDVNMRYGYDWGLGDLVTVVINDVEASSVVNEVGIGIGSDGIRIGATLGTPNATDYESRLIQRQLKTESRVSNLERNSAGTGGGGGGGGANGLPAGGTVGQIVVKDSSASYDASWQDQEFAYSQLSGVPATFAPSAHTHPISQVIDLQTDLDGKAPTVHTHAISQVIDLQTELDTKIDASALVPKADLAGAVFTGAVTAPEIALTGSQTLNEARARNITVSSAEPSGGNIGDLWVQV